jgi:WD40 repeat protein
MDASEARRLVVEALWSGPPARILSLEGLNTWSAEFSPDGHWLATFPFSENVLLFPDDGGPHLTIGGHEPPSGQPGLAFTTDGRALLTATQAEFRVRMVSIPEGKEICWLSPDLPGGDERYFGGWARLPQGVLFSVREGGSPDGPIHRLELRTCEGTPPRVLGAFDRERFAWNADPSGSRLVLVRDGRVFLRALAGPASTPERELGRLEGAVGWIRFSPRGDALVVVDSGQLKLWSLEIDAGAEPRVFHMAKPDPQFPPELDSLGTRLAWGSTAEAAVSMWRLDGPADADPIVLKKPAVRSMKKASFHPGGRFLAVTTEGSITLWDVGQPQPYVLRGHEGRIRHLQFSPDSEWLVSCGREYGVRVWPIRRRTGMWRALGNPVGLCNGFSIATD